VQRVRPLNLCAGIGESRVDRLRDLLHIRRLHRRYGHIQELIVQNFRAKRGTSMQAAPEPPLSELLWTVAAARLLLGPQARCCGGCRAAGRAAGGALWTGLAAACRSLEGLAPAKRSRPPAPFPFAGQHPGPP
jgi:FO synthase